jgi:hypothetical protein
MITIQYLEAAPELAQLDEKEVIVRLRLAADRLPFSHLLIGWHLPPRLLEGVRLEAERLGIRFLRWHPLLTGDAVLQPQPAWQIVGLTGENVLGYRRMPEFTFICPNHPEVQAAIHQRLEALLREGLYQGFFLDRVRFPSPSSAPLKDLGCFCEHCQRKAACSGLDLERIRTAILEQVNTEKGRISLVQALLGGWVSSAGEPRPDWLQLFLDFRTQSVRDFIDMLSRPLRQAHMEIGLDCFSPCLTRMVGQDLGGLGQLVDWIKVMSYAHTLGPAGLPFELLGLFDYLSSTTRLEAAQVLSLMSESIGWRLPATRQALEQDGISTDALEGEARRGVKSCTVPVLAGMELVDLKGVTHLHRDQIEADLAGLKRAGAAGLSLSWDLLHIPLDRLDLVRRSYSGV